MARGRAQQSWASPPRHTHGYETRFYKRGAVNEFAKKE
jgi:hypothetical protein